MLCYKKNLQRVKANKPSFNGRLMSLPPLKSPSNLQIADEEQKQIEDFKSRLAAVKLKSNDFAVQISVVETTLQNLG